jgi:HEAT repeat protein
MLPTPLPRAFDLLAGRPDIAADAALAESLPHFSGATQEAALRILIERGHGPTLAGLIQGFRDLEDGLKTVLLRNAVGLSAGIRSVIAAGNAADRAAAIEVIARADAPQLAHLLVDALRGECTKTRALAGHALRSLTASFVARMQCRETDPSSGLGRSNADDLSSALQRAVLTWDAHRNGEALEAALWMAERVEPAIRRKLHDPTGELLPAVRKTMQPVNDARMADFVVRALGIQPLRDAAASAITRTHDAAFKLALIRHAPLLDDADVLRGWRTIRDWQWLFGAVDLMAKLSGQDAERAVRMIALAGGPHDRKIEAFRQLLNGGQDDVRRAVLATLAADRSEAACILMRLIAGRSDDPVAAHASALLHDRPKQRAAPGAAPVAATPVPMPQEQPLTLQDLEIGLAHAEPLVRARSLQRVRKMAAAKSLANEIYRLAHDPEPVVRSLAVAMLPDVPGPTAERILRAAINDPDERVQANAIEAMDRLNLPERVAVTAPKLGSTSSRVRANAVKSLLRTELRQSAETLLQMLDAESRAHRLSALWVIERMGLSAVLDRLYELGRDDPDERVRGRANRVIRTLHGQQVVGSWWHETAFPGDPDADAEGRP